MANRRFIDFPIAASVGDNDIVLIWQDGMNKQTTKGTLIQGAPTSLEGLTDVDIAGLINGQILQYNSTTGKWENVDRTDINLSELGDVSIVSPSNGQVLVYNSSTSKWENSSGGYVPYTGAVTTVNLGAQTIQAGSFVKAGGTSAQFLKADGSVDSNTYLTTGSAAATYVPYTGATADVNLGTHDLAAERGTFENNGSSDTLTVNHTSGSGYGIIVTKGGNNEALYVSKTSGSGNAMTVVGGRTSLVDLALSSVSNTAGDFLTLSGGVVHKRTAAEVRTDIGAGTVTSVGLSSATSGVTIGSTPITTSGTITIAIATASGSQNGLLSSTDWTTFNNKQNALTNPVTGTGTTNYLPKFTGASTIGNSAITEDGTTVSLLSRALSGTSASFSSSVTAYGNAATSSAINSYNTIGGGGTAQHYQDFGNGAGFVAGRILRGNGASGLEANGLNIDNHTGFKVRLNQLGGSGGSFTIDGGNLGLGVTPSAWGVGQRAFDFGIIGSIETDGDAVAMSNNRYFDGGANRYKINDFASIFVQVNGQHIWYNAPSGTAGNAISFTQAMTLTSGGNLLVGTTTDAGFKLDVNGTGRFSSSLTANGTLVVGIDNVAGNKYVSLTPSATSTPVNIQGVHAGVGPYALSIQASGGNVLIGTTTDGASKLRLVGLPTSSVGLSSGDVYNLAGVLMIA